MSFDYSLFVTPGLGDNSYLLHSGEEAAIIDPQRDAWRFLAEANSRKVRVLYVLETHVHNDYISGALEIQKATRAEVAAPANGKYQFPHRKILDGDEIRLGSLRLVAMDTAGHTPEHISWLLYRDGQIEPLAVFSGGSLIVGSAGRTDLLGPQYTEALAGMQFETLQKFAALPRSVSLLPTHGAGSFCTAGGNGKERTSTIEVEFLTNPALQHQDRISFIEYQSRNLKSYPTYYANIAPINRKGPPILGTLPSVRRLHVSEVLSHSNSGGWIVDARDRKSFAGAHIPCSVNVELAESFATYTGWLIPFGSPIVLVLPLPLQQSLEEAVTQLIRIGYDNLIGYCDFDSWNASGEQTKSYPTGTLDELCRDYKSGKFNLIDVRQKDEWESGHVQGSVHAFVGDLPQKTVRLPQDQQMWVACASGSRASLAASYLHREGISVRLLADSGIPELLDLCS